MLKNILARLKKALYHHSGQEKPWILKERVWLDPEDDPALRSINCMRGIKLGFGYDMLRDIYGEKIFSSALKEYQY